MVKILIDSSSDLTKAEAEALGAHLIPIEVRFGDQTYWDGVDLNPRMFFEKLVESDELPKTSQINEFRFEEAFASLTEDGSEVVLIALSSKLSGTWASAAKAAKKFPGKVFAVDSLNACIGERILIEYALRLVKEGLSGAEIAAALDEKKRGIQLIALLDTLKYLRKGGRISSVAAFTGEMLSIKPVISVQDGAVKLLGKAMGSKRGNNLLTQLVAQCGGIDFSMPFALAYSGLSDVYLQKYIRDSEALWKGQTESLPVHMIGSTIGTHAGPGAIALAFFAK